MVSKVQLNQAIAESGTRYRETALTMPMMMVNESIKYLNVVTQLRGKEVQLEIDEEGNIKTLKVD